MRRARSAYAASCAKACPYSLMASAQALAEEMMASISADANCGVQASILRRISARPPWLSLKCVRSAPQQPLPAAYTTWIPAASSTRSVARSMLGSIAGCTQPCSTNTLRICVPRALCARCPLARAGTLFFNILGNKGRNICPTLSAGANQDEVSPSRRDQRTALSSGGRSTRSSTQFSADINQVPVFNTARTGCLAIEAGQAAIQVLLRAARDFGAFEHLLDEINPASWTIQFIAEQLIGRTGGIAETAVHAFAQDGRRFLALGLGGKFRA